MRASQLVQLAALLACGFSCRDHRDSPPEPPRLGNESAVRGPPEYIFGVIPLGDPVRLFGVYQPLLEAINGQHAGFKLRLETARDFVAFDDKLRARGPDLAIVNPVQALQSEARGYRIFAKMDNDDQMRGVIVVRRDSNVRSIEDLRGAAISFPARHALAATLLPKLFLWENGLDVDHDARPQYVASQDSALVNVYSGLTLAGAVWPPALQSLAKVRPQMARELKVKWTTAKLPSVAVIARRDLPASHVEVVLRVLQGLRDSVEGRAMLESLDTPGFVAADTATYAPVRRFVARYREVFEDAPDLDPEH